MPTSISNKKPVNKLSGHKGVGGPQISNNPPVPPGPGPQPIPYPIMCTSLTVQRTSSALTITGAPVACDGSHMQVDPPGNAPSMPTGGDIQTHAVTRNAVITSGAARCTADGKGVACTLDGVARNVMAPGQKSAQGPGKLVGAGGAATGGSGGGGGGGGSASTSSAKKAANASAGSSKAGASAAAGLGVDDEAGDSSNPKKGDQRRTKDPIDVLGGHVTQDEVDLTLPGVIPLVVSRDYTSERRQRDGLLGHGWALSLERRIRRRGDILALDLGDGRQAFCEPVASGHRWLHRRERLELIGCDRGYDVFDLDGRLTYRFEGTRDDAALSAIIDAWGNRVTFEYTGGRLSRVIDTAGRQLVLRHDGDGHVTRLEVWSSPPLSEEDLAAGAQPQAPTLT